MQDFRPSKHPPGDSVLTLTELLVSQRSSGSQGFLTVLGTTRGEEGGVRAEEASCPGVCGGRKGLAVLMTPEPRTKQVHEGTWERRVGTNSRHWWVLQARRKEKRDYNCDA